MEPNDLAFTPKGVFVAKNPVSDEGSFRLEKATFRPRIYCKPWIEVLEKYARLLGTYVNLQFAVQLALILTFSPSIKNHSAYNIQLYMSVKETRYLNLLQKNNHFSLEQCLGESLSKFCVVSMLPLLNLEIALSAHFGNRRLLTKPRTKRG